MNVQSTLRLIALAGLALSLDALASPIDTGSQPAPLAWDCARAGAPTYAEVLEHFEVRDFHRAHRASLHLREVAKRGCKGGADSLLLVARPGAEGALQFDAIAAR
jgi:hypothetical protein